MDSLDSQRTVEELIEMLTSGRSSQEQFEAALASIRRRGTREVFDRATAMCGDSDPKTRQIGVQILCQLGGRERKFGDESLQIFLDLLAREKDHGVLAAVGWGLGHLGKRFAVERLIELKGHENADVRLGVVGGLLGNSDERAIQTLIDLSDDVEARVRNWATAGIGMMCELDRKDIREALYKRLSDSDEETRLEALYGLAKRRDLRVLNLLKARLSPESADYLDVLAAESLADPRLVPALLRLKPLWNGIEEVLQRAIDRCQQGKQDRQD